MHVYSTGKRLVKILTVGNIVVDLLENDGTLHSWKIISSSTAGSADDYLPQRELDLSLHCLGSRQ